MNDRLAKSIVKDCEGAAGFLGDRCESIRFTVFDGRVDIVWDGAMDE